jgi:hypothetical protein
LFDGFANDLPDFFNEADPAGFKINNTDPTMDRTILFMTTDFLA